MNITELKAKAFDLICKIRAAELDMDVMKEQYMAILKDINEIKKYQKTGLINGR